jgi:hypothetical protein
MDPDGAAAETTGGGACTEAASAGRGSATPGRTGAPLAAATATPAGAGLARPMTSATDPPATTAPATIASATRRPRDPGLRPADDVVRGDIVGA